VAPGPCLGGQHPGALAGYGNSISGIWAACSRRAFSSPPLHRPHAGAPQPGTTPWPEPPRHQAPAAGAQGHAPARVHRRPRLL